MSEIKCIVSGIVQIVMYRSFAERKALALRLKGTVRNLPDGTVEVVAQGDREKLEKFIENLHKGSIFSRVDNVEVIWREPGIIFDEFRIVF